MMDDKRKLLSLKYSAEVVFCILYSRNIKAKKIGFLVVHLLYFCRVTCHDNKNVILVSMVCLPKERANTASTE